MEIKRSFWQNEACKKVQNFLSCMAILLVNIVENI